MSRLDKYILSTFLPVFIGGLAFFILALQLADIIPNLWKYIVYEPSPKDIGMMVLLYTPRCVSYSLPVALLFAVSYSLGDLYAKNELIAIFTSGVSLYRFTIPLMAIGALLSIGSFFFEDSLVIDMTRKKVELSRTLLKQSVVSSWTDITVMSKNGAITYQAGYFNSKEKTLSNVVIVKRADDGGFLSRINSDACTWDGEAWNFPRATVYAWDPESNRVVDSIFTAWRDQDLDEPPETFMKSGFPISELKVAEARRYVNQLKRAGFPYTGELAEYYKRYSFALTPLIVILLSSTLGGRFRKNILLMSLFGSLVIATLYYVFQMVTMLMATFGFLSPFLGAWLPFILFFIVALFLFRHART